MLDVPESAIDTAVDIQISTEESSDNPAEPGESPEEESVQTAEEAVEDVEQEEVVEEENIKQAETAPDEESEEVKSLKLKIKAYTPDYKYTLEDKKDPFSKPGALKDLTTSPEDRLHPVEQDSIDNIQLKAIIWGRDGVIPRALFEVQNKTYTLTENDRIGQEGALIARIETDRIWAMKPVTDPASGLVRFEPYEKILSPAGAGSATKETELFYER